MWQEEVYVPKRKTDKKASRRFPGVGPLYKEETDPRRKTPKMKGVLQQKFQLARQHKEQARAQGLKPFHWGALKAIPRTQVLCSHERPVVTRSSCPIF